MLKLVVKKDGLVSQNISVPTASDPLFLLKIICEKWNLPDYQKYALVSENGTFITTKNFKEIKDNAIIHIQTSPYRICNDIIQILSNLTTEKEFACKSSLYAETLNKLGLKTTSNYYVINAVSDSFNGKEFSEKLLIFNRHTKDSYFNEIFIENNGLSSLLKAFNYFLDFRKSDISDENTKLNILSELIFCLHNMLTTEALDVSYLEEYIPKIIDILNNLQIIYHGQVCTRIFNFLSAIIPLCNFSFIHSINLPPMLTLYFNSMEHELHLSLLNFMVVLLDTIYHNDVKMHLDTVEKILAMQPDINHVIVKTFFKPYPVHTDIVEKLCLLQIHILRPVFNLLVPLETHSEIYRYLLTDVENKIKSKPNLDNALDDYDIVQYPSNQNQSIKNFLEESDTGVFAVKCILYHSSSYSSNFEKIMEHLGTENNGQKLLKAIDVIMFVVNTIVDYFSLKHLKEYSVLNFTNAPTSLLLLLYTRKHCLYEIYVLTINLYIRTWREMKASTVSDSNKVCTVVGEILRLSLLLDNSNFVVSANTDSYINRHLIFETIILNFESINYHKLLTDPEFSTNKVHDIIPTTDKNDQNVIKEIYNNFLPDIEDMVLENRWNKMCQGTFFLHQPQKNSQRIKDRYCCLQLSTDKTFLMYTFCDHQDPARIVHKNVNIIMVKNINLDISTNKISTGPLNSSPMQKPQKKLLTMINYYFLILGEFLISSNSLCLWGSSEDFTTIGGSLSLLAPDEHIYNVWYYGLQNLIGNRVFSKDMKKDIEEFMELRIILLKMKS